MKNWRSHNQKAFKAEVERYKAYLHRQLVAAMTRVAEGVLAEIETRVGMPFYTGNLSDSTGVGVYVDGVLETYMPRQLATQPQTYFGEEVWGHEDLVDAIELGRSTFNTGIWIVVYSAVPYAASMEIYSDPPYFSSFVVDELVSQFFANASEIMSMVSRTKQVTIEPF